MTALGIYRGKAPALPGTRYVIGLVARDVVNTMPEKTMLATADHGIIPTANIILLALSRPDGWRVQRLPPKPPTPRTGQT